MIGTFSHHHLHLIIFLALVISSVSHLEAFTPQNCILKISGNELEDKSGLCVAEYSTNDCTEFVGTFNQSLLPEELRNDLSIEKPSNLFLKPALNPHKTKLIPGMIISWESPRSGMARIALQGFLMTYTYKNSTGVVEGMDCRLFQFSPREIPSSKLLFSYDLKYVRPNKNYFVNVYSLPPPSSSEFKQPDSFLESFTWTGSALDMSKLEPSRYRPSVSLSPRRDGKLLVSINLSPPIFNFTVYTLKLKKKSHGISNTFKEEEFVTEVQSQYKQSDTFTFDGLQSGEYSVVVRPKDLFKKVDNMCLCWKRTQLQERFCEFNCDSVETNWIRLNRDIPVTDEPDIHQTTTNSDKTTGKSLEPSKAHIDIIIVLAVLTFLIILVAIYIFRKRHCIKELPGLGEKKLSLTTKTVYILSSMDHTAHEHLVEALAKFLNVHCHCKVIYPPWHDVHHEGGYTWLVSNMSCADIILFVDSEGAEKLMNAYMGKKIYRSFKVGPEGDLFTLGSKRILSMGSNPEVWETIVPVNFGSVDWCRKYLMSPMVYQLPHNLPLLLQKIHRLSSKDVKSQQIHLPLCVKNLKAFTEGTELLSAIQSSEQYASDHPNWLQEQFGEATSIFTQALSSSHSSGDSDYGSLIYDRTISVSTQDLNTAGSPVSMVDRPVFSVLGWQKSQSSTKSLPCNSTHQKYINPENGVLTTSHQLFHLPDDGCSVVTVGTDIPSTLGKLRIFPTVTSGMMTHPQALTVHDEGYRCLPCVLPPESASAIHSDSVSTALKAINCRTEAVQDDSQRHEVSSADTDQGSLFEKDQCSEDFDITPPDMLSDILSETLSMSFLEINAASEMEYINNEGQDLNEIELEEHSISLGKEFNTVSV